MTNRIQFLRFALRLRWKNLIVAALVALAFLFGIGVRSYAAETLRIFNPASLMGNVATEQFQMALISLLTCLSLGLVVVGIYGVMAHTVTQQTPEIGLRLADGAKTSEVLKLVFVHGLKLVGLGSLIGLGVAFLFARWIKVLRFGIEASDPLTFAGVAVVLSGVVGITALLPARRTPNLKPLTIRYK